MSIASVVKLSHSPVVTTGRILLVWLLVVLILVSIVTKPLYSEELTPVAGRTHVLAIGRCGSEWKMDLNHKTGTLLDIIKRIESGNEVSNGDRFEVRFIDSENIDLSFSPPYNQSGLIPLLLSAGVKVEYFDARGRRIPYRTLTWSKYVKGDDNPEMAEFTLDGKAIDRENIYDVLKTGDISGGSCLQIVCPWPISFTEPLPEYPFDFGMLSALARKKEVRLEVVYLGYASRR